MHRTIKPDMFPPPAEHVAVYPEEFDLRRLNAHHQQELKSIAAKHNFEYDQNMMHDLNSLLFSQNTPDAEMFAHAAIFEWKKGEGGEELPEHSLSPAEFIEATRIFLRFIQSQIFKLDTEQNLYAGIIAADLIDGCDHKLLKKDAEIQRLSKRIIARSEMAHDTLSKGT